MTTYLTLVSWIILALGPVLISFTVSSPAALPAVRGDALNGTNGGYDGHSALPFSRQDTQLYNLTGDDTYTGQSAHDGEDEAHDEHGNPQFQQPEYDDHSTSELDIVQGEQGSQSIPLSDSGEVLGRGTRHLPGEDRNGSYVMDESETDQLNDGEGHDFPITNEEHIGEGMDIHHGQGHSMPIEGTDIGQRLSMPSDGTDIGQGLSMPSDGTDIGQGLSMPSDGTDIGQGLSMPSEGTDIHQGLLPEDHDYPEGLADPSHSEHVRFLPDNPNPLPVHPQESGQAGNYPEDVVPSTSPNTDSHAMTSEEAVRHLPTESVPVNLPRGQGHHQFQGHDSNIDPESGNVTNSDNETESHLIDTSEKLEWTSKFPVSQETQTVSSSEVNPVTDHVSGTIHFQEEVTSGQSSHSIQPTLSIPVSYSLTLGTDQSYQTDLVSLDLWPSSLMTSQTTATFPSGVHDEHSMVQDFTSSDDVSVTSQLLPSVMYPTPSESLGSMFIETSVYNGDVFSTMTAQELQSSSMAYVFQSSYIPSVTDLATSSLPEYDSSSNDNLDVTTQSTFHSMSPSLYTSSTFSINSRADNSDVWNSDVAKPTVSIHLEHLSVSPTRSPVAPSLSLTSQGLVMPDNDHHEHRSTEEYPNLTTKRDTSSIPNSSNNSSDSTPESPTHGTDSSSTNSPTFPHDRSSSASPGSTDGASNVTSTVLSTAVTPSAEVSSTEASDRSVNTETTTGSTVSSVPRTTVKETEVPGTTRRVTRTSTKEPDKPAGVTGTVTANHTGNVTFTRSTSVGSTTASTSGLSVNATTTTKYPNSSNKDDHRRILPAVFISIELQMTLTDFCSQKAMFITELVEIVKSNDRQMDIQEQQLVLLAIHPKMCDKLSRPFVGDDIEEEKVKVELYCQDTDGKADISMTTDVYKIIKPGFESYTESRFKQKLVNVKLVHRNIDMGEIKGHGHAGSTVSKSKLEPGITIVIVIASVGGFCCICLLLLQIVIHRRQNGKRMKSFHMGSSGLSTVPSMDSIALGVVPKSRPNSGFWNPGLEQEEQNEPSEPMNLLNYTSLSNLTMDNEAREREFESLPMDMPRLSSVPVGSEDKNRFANVIPVPHTRVRLKKRPEEDNSDYINANYVTGYSNANKTYIATQAPMYKTMSDFWRMVWEQQSRAILMLTPMRDNGQPSCDTYWPDMVGMDSCLQFGDFTVVLKRKDIQQEYTVSVLQLKDIENNLIREVRHFWYTSWPCGGVPEPISLVKFVLDSRPHFEDSGAPVIVHCSPGTGRTGTLMAIDSCMRSFEDRRRVDVLNCVYRMRGERAGAVQTNTQYGLIYSALHEYATVVNSPKVSISSTAVALHNML